jgi:hypothetical protein
MFLTMEVVMWRSGLFFVLFLLFTTTCVANENSQRVAQPIPWPAKYEGDVIPITSGNISISVPADVIRVFYDEDGVGIQFKDKSIIGISRINGDFYKSKQIPNGITAQNKISVSFAGKIPYTHTSIPESVKENDIDWQIWRYAIAMRSVIYNSDNIVNITNSGQIEIYYYYSTSKKSPILAEVHSRDESSYLLITGSGFEIDKFTSILGTIDEPN